MPVLYSALAEERIDVNVIGVTDALTLNGVQVESWSHDHVQVLDTEQARLVCREASIAFEERSDRLDIVVDDGTAMSNRLWGLISTSAFDRGLFGEAWPRVCSQCLGCRTEQV